MPVTKLTREQIIEAARLSALGVPSTRIARNFGVCQMTAWRAINQYAARLAPAVTPDAAYRIKRRGVKRLRDLEKLGRVPQDR